MGESIKLVVESGEHTRHGCPVSVLLPWTYKEASGIELKEESSGKRVVCQIGKAPKGGAKLLWILDNLKAGESRSYIAERLENPQTSSGAAGVRFVNHIDSSKLDVLMDGDLFTSYHYGSEWVRPFLHPVIGPYGVRVTRNWPIEDSVPDEKRDHPHHKSIWVAYGDCNGVDNWSEEPNHGWQRTLYKNSNPFWEMESGPVFGRFLTKTAWCTPEERKQFEDTREFTFYALPGGVRMFDLVLTFHMTKSITFRDTKEGGLISVRVATSMDVPRGGKIQNGYGGINEKETWGKSAPWCDYSGIVDGKHVGIALFDHEQNPRYPTGWHVRNYGLMTANCFAWSYYRPEAKIKGHMVFKKNSRTTWRYRVYIHKGDAVTGKVADRFLDFISPPEIRIE